jgi:hypothetical protein
MRITPVIVIYAALATSLSAKPCALPKEAAARFERELNSKYARLAKMKPCSLKADFDGDGAMDTAVLIEERKSHKTGIAILTSSSGTWKIVAAGHRFEGQDNLDWMDQWSVYPKGPVEEGVEAGPPPKLRGAAILAEKSESASGLIYWTGHEYAWYQQGD